jgi:hypothetical protein
MLYGDVVNPISISRLQKTSKTIGRILRRPSRTWNQY